MRNEMVRANCIERKEHAMAGKNNTFEIWSVEHDLAAFETVQKIGQWRSMGRFLI